jgi:Secretion system C-terminal sorting domain
MIPKNESLNICNLCLVTMKSYFQFKLERVRQVERPVDGAFWVANPKRARVHTICERGVLKPMSVNTPSLYLSALLNFDRVEEVKAALENLSTENVETKPLKKVFTILLDLKAADKNILNLNTEQENQLFEVATGTSQARFQAQSMLEQKTGIEFRRPTEKWESHFEGGVNERSVEDLPQLGSINLIPNPASNSVKIAWNLDESVLIGQVTLTNIYGVTQKVQKIEGATGEIEVNLQGLSDGIYFVRVGNKTNFRVQKLLIQH